MVIAKPIQVTIVRDVPLVFSGAFCAINVENRGESAITTIPQKNRNAMKRKVTFVFKSTGDSRQQMHDRHKEMAAIFLAPDVREIYPLRIQPKLPDPITRNDIKDIFRLTAG